VPTEAEAPTQTHKFPFILTLTFEFLMKFQTFLTPQNCFRWPFHPQAAESAILSPGWSAKSANEDEVNLCSSPN